MPQHPLGNPTARSLSTLVCCIVFVDLLAFGFVGPLVPLYVRDFGGDGRSAGLTVSAFAAASFLSLPLLGRLSDRVGRRPVIALSLAGNALAFLLLAFAVRQRSLVWLFAARLCAGAVAGNVTTCQSVIADVSSPAERGKHLGQLGAALGLGLIAGPGLGSFMYARAAWLPPLAAALVTALDVIAVLVLLPESLAERMSSAPAASVRAALSRPVALVLAQHFLFFGCMAVLQAFLPLFVEARLAWGAREVGMLFGGSALLGLVVQGSAIGPMARAIPAQRALAVGGALLAVGMLGLSLAQSPPAVLASLAGAGIGLGIATPMLTLLALAAAPRALQGIVLGLSQSSAGLARAVAPLAGGALFDAAGAGAPFAGCAAVALASCALGALGPRSAEQTEVAI